MKYLRKKQEQSRLKMKSICEDGERNKQRPTTGGMKAP